MERRRGGERRGEEDRPVATTFPTYMHMQMHIAGKRSLDRSSRAHLPNQTPLRSLLNLKAATVNLLMA